MPRSFEELVAEAEAADVTGWDFSWLDGRATEERPPWGYARLMGERMARARAALDLQTGGGEVLARVPVLPPLAVATESWPPNIARAAAKLRPRGAWIVADDDGPRLPFADACFDLVVSRHPVDTRWDEVARVLEPGGVFFSQQIGPDTSAEVTEFFMGPYPRGESGREPALAVAEAGAAGLELLDLREVTLRMEFFDVGAMIYFLRKVVWTVPDFTVGRYRARLRDLHERIASEGPFVGFSRRFLIEARKPLG